MKNYKKYEEFSEEAKRVLDVSHEMYDILMEKTTPEEGINAVTCLLADIFSGGTNESCIEKARMALDVIKSTVLNTLAARGWE